MKPVKLIFDQPLFAGHATVEISPDQAAMLRRSSIVQSNGSSAKFTLVAPDKSNLLVETIEQLREAEEKGYYAPTTFDMVMHSRFELASNIISALLVAKESRESFLAPISNIELLPAKLLSLYINVGDPIYNSKIPDYKSLTILEMSNDGLCTIDERTPTSVSITAGVRCNLTELLRGDLDGDGIEDMLVWQGCRVLGGTMRWANSLALTRHGPLSLFSATSLPFR